jgi:hypothetical protein
MKPAIGQHAVSDRAGESPGSKLGEYRQQAIYPECTGAQNETNAEAAGKPSPITA